MAHGACIVYAMPACAFYLFRWQRNDDDGQEMLVIHLCLAEMNAKPVRLKNHQTKHNFAYLCMIQSLAGLCTGNMSNSRRSRRCFKFWAGKKPTLESSYVCILYGVHIGMVTGFRGHLLIVSICDYFFCIPLLRRLIVTILYFRFRDNRFSILFINRSIIVIFFSRYTMKTTTTKRKWWGREKKS